MWRTEMTPLAYKQSFQLTPEQDLTLFNIASKMKRSKLPSDFISAAIRTALKYEGVADLIFLWAKEDNNKERDEIIADLQDLIDDCQRPPTAEHHFIKLNDLDQIRDHIRAFKDELLRIVDKNGGISKLAQITHIPQPSLSRFFNSNAMPRRQTLLKIATALKLDSLCIDTPWSR
jgi:DNA-binding phage protein